MRASSVAVESKGNWTIMRDPKSKCVFTTMRKVGCRNGRHLLALKLQAHHGVHDDALL